MGWMTGSTSGEDRIACMILQRITVLRDEMRRVKSKESKESCIVVRSY